MMLPAAFLSRMQAQLGNEYADFLASYEQPPDVGLRVNTLKLSPQEFASLAPDLLNPNALSPLPWCSAGFVVPPESRPGKHPYHAAGLYYLQDPAAQAVAELLAPQPGERVLDLSAAPGGKATHIASLMQNQGLLVANDMHPKRVRDLAKNLERWGARNVAITQAMPPQLVEHFGSFFDRVLVDAPCSGEGMFRKDPAARGEWQPKLVESCALRQDAILVDAAKLVRPGGFLVYSTCTFAPEENEGTLTRFLDAHVDFELVAVPRFPGFNHGCPEWLKSSPAAPLPPGEGGDLAFGLERAVRLWPHEAPGEGHFIALLHRAEDALPLPSSLAPFQVSSLPTDVQRDFVEFAVSTLNWQPPQDRLSLLGSYLYLIPDGLPDLRGLSVIHWGWWLGTAKKNRFEPSHALAMGLRSEDIRNTLPLNAADPQLMRYLRGEVLPSPGPNGWVLVTVDGFPLGWGKRVQGRLKSHLPTWLRRM